MPPLAFACSLAIHAAVACVAGGVVALLLKAEPLSLARLLSASVSDGVGVAIWAVTVGIWARSRKDASEGRSIAEYRRLRDLD